MGREARRRRGDTGRMCNRRPGVVSPRSRTFKHAGIRGATLNTSDNLTSDNL